ncbi:MAG: SGNH/GDSL hydrolase family protein [Cocleimonas sp.]|nr:SGNH/GDSL hydrolase family protein [Cocleimonas sp.]
MTIIQFLKVQKYPINIFLVGMFFISPSTGFSSEYDYPDQQSNIIDLVNNKLYDHYAFDKCRSLQAKSFNMQSQKKKLIIIGDSQGCDFLNGMIENGYLRNYQIQFRFIPYACQKVPYENINLYISLKHQQFCMTTKRLDSLKKAKQQVANADLVIFAALWKPAVAKKLPKIFQYLQIKKHQRLVVIGYKFFGGISAKKYANLPNNKRRLTRVNVGKKALEINSILRNTLGNNVTFVNPHKLMCNNFTSCPVFTSALELISYDGRHLTKAGARYMGKILFQKTQLGSI